MLAVEYTPPINRDLLEFTKDDVAENVEYWQYALIGTIVGFAYSFGGS